MDDTSLEQPLEFSTPMMLQYMAIKEQYPDCLVFFRLGDFYEMFLDDARTAATVLDITLTSRSRGKDGRIPMAGVPYHAVDGYLAKLTKSGHKVVICDQVSEPDGKNLVERQVTRIVTPGTTTQDQALEAKSANYILSVCLHVDKKTHTLGLAAAELTTGQLLADSVVLKILPPNHLTSPASLSSQFADVLTQVNSLLTPAEVLTSAEDLTSPEFSSLLATLPTSLTAHHTVLDTWSADPKQALKTLRRVLRTKVLHPYEAVAAPAAQVALANLLSYLEYTQRQSLAHLQPPKPLPTTDRVTLDPSTIANLELVTSLHGRSKNGSLLAVLDKTRTAMGGRLLKQWLLQPLTNLTAITFRLDAIDWLTAHYQSAQVWQARLSVMADVERLLARVHLGQSDPRQLKNLEFLIREAAALADDLVTLAPTFAATFGPALQSQELDSLALILAKTMIDAPPADAKQGGFVKPGIHDQLDRQQAVVTEHQQLMADLESTLRSQTAIASLKIKYNKVFGYYIEVSRANLHLVPTTFERKQTLVNAERFITPTMKAWETTIVTGQESTKELEWQIYQQLLAKVKHLTPKLQRLAQALAELDCLLALAQVAVTHHYHRPTVTKQSQIVVQAGRHPVVEQVVGSHVFVPNDITLNATNHQVMLITGPNMAGKSVVMRQVALIVLLAHVGSFVPAQTATIGLVDRIFVRSGASDAIAQGLSTFMVEMVETAHILHHATSKSLVIMDEIGRGTSTYDGISLAWAIAESLVTNPHQRPQKLFATHYHELQQLTLHHPKRIFNYQMAVDNSHADPLFLYLLKPGASEHSYGVAVAKLAGIPAAVTTNAQAILHRLESERTAAAVLHADH